MSPAHPTSIHLFVLNFCKYSVFLSVLYCSGKECSTTKKLIDDIYIVMKIVVFIFALMKFHLIFREWEKS